MKQIYQRLLLVSFLLLFAFYVRATDEAVPVKEATFNLGSIQKKGIRLSDLGLWKEGFQNLKIRDSKAIRIDNNYVPMDGVQPFNLPFEEVKKHVDRANASLKQVTDNEMFTTVLKGKNITLPVGIKKTIGNSTITICIDSLVFTARYAYAVVYAIVEDKKNKKKLAFYGKDIRFTKDGGFTGDARIELLQTYDMAFGDKVNVKFLVDATHKNYVVFNCAGFKHLHVDTKVIFSRDMLIPENTDGTLNTNPLTKVSTGFMADLEGFDDWMVQISNMPSFQVKGWEGTSFSVQTLTFDYSSVINPTGIVYPANYDYPTFGTGISNNVWEGFYVSNLTVRLPKEFKLKNNATKRIELTMEKGIIDKMGFTGSIAVKNLLAMGDAKMVSWDYSLDTIRVTFLKSTPTAASFSGRLKIPITKDTEVFGFTANILPNNQYNFTVRNSSKLNFPLWGMGQIDIYKDSYIKVEINQGEFTPTALLSGICKIGADVNGKTGVNDTTKADNSLTLASIEFQKILVTVTAPYLDLAPGGSISLGGNSQKMSKMPVCLNQLGIVKDMSGRVGILIKLTVNLLGKGDPGAFGASATVTVWGERNPQNEKWQYYKTQLDRLSINVDINAVSVKGYIEFFRDDVTYGSGFAGGVEIKIKALQGLGMSSNVLFGKKKRAATDDIFRYWYVDGNITLGSLRIPILPVLYISAMGAGAYYGVEAITDKTIDTKFKDKNGVGYIPKETAGLGLKAMLAVEGPTKQVFNGELGLEISFSTTGSLEYIIFSGMVQCVEFKGASGLTNMANKYKELQEKTKLASLVSQKNTKPKPAEVNAEINKKSGGAIMVKWMMEYNAVKKEFVADVDLFVNVVSVITGAYPANHAGSLNIYIGPNKWFYRLGVPNKPMAIKALDIATATTYFVAGHDLPAPLPMPNGHSSDFTSSVKGDAGLGKGFGFGARIAIKGKLGGPIYAFIEGGLGADIFLFNEGTVYCSSTGANRGIKDWYAFGQVYVYVKAGVGIDICVPMIRATCQCCVRVCLFRKCKNICSGFNACCWETYKACAKKEWSAQIGIAAEFQGIKPFWGKLYIDNPIKSFSLEVGKKCN